MNGVPILSLAKLTFPEYSPTNADDDIDFRTNDTEYNEPIPDELKVGEVNLVLSVNLLFCWY